ncbi:hypothetical protein Cgig2_021181 [Carnegiea gigantea]|uniref:DUF4283 domain-containing protein n=1 Tax=Carnegiea gigantea TaxID=171969 RepID=A0A9Q1KVZ5_9CARY|nr:hypothetical protein Cgig2_021181 [Carnegiea gigantea]
MKRISTGNPAEATDCEDVEILELESGSPNVPETVPLNPLTVGRGRVASYRNTLRRNNPNLEFETRENPIRDADGFDDASEDDEPPEEDNPTCPTILLTAAEKRMLLEPRRNALIIKMFDKGIGFLQLKRRLKIKWELKGDFSLIDIGHDYYVTRNEVDRNPSRSGQNLVSNMYMESRENNATRVHQLSRNQNPHMEMNTIYAQDQGSRFRALANLDLNIEVEPVTESEETQGDKEDYMPQLEGAYLDSEINEDNMEKERLGADTPSALGKGNVPQTSPR